LVAQNTHALVHQLEDFRGGLGRLQPERARRAHDPFRVEVEIRPASFEGTAAVEHHRAQPEGVIARPQDRGIALVPRAVPVGERVHVVLGLVVLGLGSGRK
jgi:hypothetical protein